MNILFVNPFWKPYRGGIEKVIEKLLEEFEKNDQFNKLGILTSYNLYPLGSLEDAPYKEKYGKLTVYRLNFFPRNIPFITNLKNSGYISLGINKVINDFEPDIIQYMTDGWYIPNLLIYAETGTRCKQVFSPFYHDLQDTLGNKPMIWANSYLAQHVDAIQVYSDTEKNKIHEIYGAQTNKIIKLSLGVDIPSKKSPHKEKTIKLLCVGRIGPAKGQFELVRIYKKLISSDSKIVNTRLILVGNDGGDLEKIKVYIEKNKLSAFIDIKTFVSDNELNNIYDHADIYVSATKYESFGLAAVEALAHKLPVLTYSIGAIPEVLKQGALLIEPFNTNKMLEALKLLVKKDNFRKKLGEEGFNYVKNRYSWSKVSESYAEIYKSLIV